jgi:hypothetical protein
MEWWDIRATAIHVICAGERTIGRRSGCVGLRESALHLTIVLSNRFSEINALREPKVSGLHAHGDGIFMQCPFLFRPFDANAAIS